MIEPLVSILIPTFDRKALLLETLKSVWRDEDFSYEIIVGDNSSADGTVEMCTEFFRQTPPIGMVHAAVLQQSSNIGMVKNWNALLESAHGKYVRLLCDDDLLLDGALAREISALEKNPEAAICSSARLELENRFFILPNETRKEFAEVKRFSTEDKKLHGAEALAAMIHGENIFGSPSAVLFRRNALASFSEKFQYATDWAAWLEICEKYGAILLSEPGCWFRLHEGNLTSRFVWAGVDIEEVFALRWKALRFLEKKSGIQLSQERKYLALALWLKLTRRAAKLLFAGKFEKFFPTLKRVILAIAQEK